SAVSAVGVAASVMGMGSPFSTTEMRDTRVECGGTALRLANSSSNGLVCAEVTAKTGDVNEFAAKNDSRSGAVGPQYRGKNGSNRPPVNASRQHRKLVPALRGRHQANPTASKPMTSAHRSDQPAMRNTTGRA